MTILLIMIAACQPPAPAEPTPIPSESATVTLTVSPSPSMTPGAVPTGFPTAMTFIEVTPVPTGVSQLVEIQPSATLGPQCFRVAQGDTLFGLIARAGYTDLSVLPQVVADNSIVNNNISVGQTICVARKTPTPLPQGYAETQSARATEVPLLNAGPAFAPATYVIKKGDTIGLITINLGISLRQVCDLNPPPDLICPETCDFSNPIAPKCRIPIVEGKSLKIPGPTQTPTVTPTLTGSETPTATPGYSAPRIISPAQGDLVTGVPQLLWIDTVLESGTFYFLWWSDPATTLIQTHLLDRASFRLLIDYAPPAGETHMINWRVGIARQGADGQAEMISPMSDIYTFNWTR